MGITYYIIGFLASFFGGFLFNEKGMKVFSIILFILGYINIHYAYNTFFAG